MGRFPPPPSWPNHRVVVTGIGMITPLGVTSSQTWKNLLLGKSGVQVMTPEEYDIPLLSQLPTQLGAVVDREYVQKYESPGYWRGLSPFIRYSVIASDEALSHAKWKPTTTAGKNRSGVALGTGIGCLEEIIKANNTIHDKGIRQLSPHFVPKILGNLAAGQVSIRNGLAGPNLATITACASGAHAIGEAFSLIKTGQADVMVAGGTEASINELSIAGFSRLRALSTKYNDNPELASRPFDSGRDGFVIGEGAAVLVLEEMEHAIARGADIIAEMRGFGYSGDAHHITAPSSDGDGAQRAMIAALKCSGFTPNNIDYINAHATSTPMGDIVEAKAIEGIFGSQRISVSSTKGATGHLLGASGSLEAAITVLSLQHSTMPFTKNLDDPDEKIPTSIDLIRNEPKEIPEGQYNVAMSNSFGFGGTNTSLIFSNL